MQEPLFRRETQQKINRLLRFFTRQHSGGFLLAVAEDQRIISSINRQLVAAAEQQGQHLNLFFFDEKSDLPLLEQLRRAADTRSQGIIFGNMDRLFSKNKSPDQDLLAELNFGREAIHRLGKPLLFWVSPANFALLQRRAADLFTQRAASTLFFDVDGSETNTAPAPLNTAPDAGKVLDEATEQSLLDKVSLLVRQLREAEKTQQPRARIALNIALPLAENLAELDDPEALQLLNDYAADFRDHDPDALARRGKVYLLMHQFQQAETLLRLALEQMENPAFDFPRTVALIDLGDLLTRTGRLPEALSIFEESTTIREKCCATQPDSATYKHKLGQAYSRLGETHAALGDLPKALTFFEDQTKLFEALHHTYPQNVEFKNGLAISYEKLGETHAALGDLPKALTFFEKDNALETALHKAYPQNVKFKNGLALSYQLLGWFYETKLEKTDKAKENYRASKLLLEDLAERFPDYVEFRKNLDWVKSKL